MSSQDRTELEMLVRESQHQVGQLVRLLRTTLVLGGVAAGAALIGVTALPGRSQTTAPRAAAEAVAHAAKPQNVLVTNSSASPVPVNGTVTANVVGTVSAQQSGVWNVGITGTPQTLLANPANNPGYVYDLSHASRQDYSRRVAVGIAPGATSNYTDFPDSVPPGKRLVLELVTLSGDLPANQGLFGMIVVHPASVPGSTVQHSIATQRVNSSKIVATQPVKIYADAFDTPQIQVNRYPDSTGQANILVTLGGYLEDVN